MNYKKMIAVVGGVVSAIAEQYTICLILLLFSIIFDIVTGLIASYKEGTGWNSQKAREGFLSKMGYLVAFGFGIFLDYFFPYVLSLVSITLPFDSPFGLIIATYIILNECISICENLYRTDHNILPSWVLKLLSIAKNEIDKKDGEEDAENK